MADTLPQPAPWERARAAAEAKEAARQAEAKKIFDALPRQQRRFLMRKGRRESSYRFSVAPRKDHSQTREIARRLRQEERRAKR